MSAISGRDASAITNAVGRRSNQIEIEVSFAAGQNATVAAAHTT